MNYHHADWVYRRHGLEKYATEEYSSGTEQRLRAELAEMGVEM
jgi:hypothetical protein